MDLRKENFENFLSLQLSIRMYTPCSSWMNEAQDFSYLSVLEMDEIIEVGIVGSSIDHPQWNLNKVKQRFGKFQCWYILGFYKNCWVPV